MMTDFLTLRHSRNQFVRKILRMRSHKTDTFQAFYVFQHFQKLCKCYRMFQRLTVRVYILSQKHNLRHPISNQTFYFFDNCLRLTAAFTSTYIRNDTVTAEIIAAKHDIDTGFKCIISFCRKVLNNLVGTFPDVYDLLFGLEHFIKKLCILKNVMCTKYQINKWIRFLDLIYYMLFLHHTSEKNDLHIRIAVFQTVQMTKSSIYFKVCIFADSTGIVDYNVRFFIVLSVIADLIHDSGYCL